MKTLALLAVLIGVSFSQAVAQDRTQAAAAVRLEQLAWLAGSWSGPQGKSEVEESWLPPKGGLMLGVNRTVSSTGKGAFEFLRIATEGADIVYYASPGGEKPTPFKLVKAAENQVTFENAEHDFPQRISYERTGDQLRARIEGKINGQARSMEWSWKRTKSE